MLVDIPVRGASALAAGFGISALTIGLTVVSVGTSMPELFVSVTSGLEGKADLAIANVLGSNIDITMVVASSMMILLAVATSRTATISRGFGVFFMLLYVGYLSYLIQRG